VNALANCQIPFTLNHGMTVLRRAMTIEVGPEKRTG